LSQPCRSSSTICCSRGLRWMGRSLIQHPGGNILVASHGVRE
jgi:hypothetical protein